MLILSAILIEFALNLISILYLILFFLPFLTFNIENLRVGNRVASEILIYLLILILIFDLGKNFTLHFKELTIIIFILLNSILLLIDKKRMILISNMKKYKRYITKEMILVFILGYLANFISIINFGVDANNHLQKILNLSSQSYDGYPEGWHSIFKFKSDFITILLFDKIVFWLGISVLMLTLIGLVKKNKIQIIFLLVFPLTFILKWTLTAWPTQMWVIYLYLFLIFSEFAVKKIIKFKEMLILIIINLNLLITNPSLFILLNTSLILVLLTFESNLNKRKKINTLKIIISITLSSIFTVALHLYKAKFATYLFNSYYSVPISGGINYGDGSQYTNGLFQTIYHLFMFKQAINFFKSPLIFYSIFISMIFLIFLRYINSKGFEKIVLTFFVVTLFSVMTGIGEPAVIRGRFMIIILMLFWINLFNYNFRIVKISNYKIFYVSISILFSILFLFQVINYERLNIIWDIRSSMYNSENFRKYDSLSLNLLKHEIQFFDRLIIFDDTCNSKKMRYLFCSEKDKINFVEKTWTTNFFREGF